MEIPLCQVFRVSWGEFIYLFLNLNLCNCSSGSLTLCGNSGEALFACCPSGDLSPMSGPQVSLAHIKNFSALTRKKNAGIVRAHLIRLVSVNRKDYITGA